MRKYNVEAYEDNAGRAYLFAVDANENTVWAASYDEAGTELAKDFMAIAFCSANPVAEGWEHGTLSAEEIAEIDRYALKDNGSELIAKTDDSCEPFCALIVLDSQGEPICKRLAKALGECND